MPSQFPELALGAPEAAETEHRFFRAVRIRALERTVIQKMLGGGSDGVGAARQSLAGLWHGNLLEAEHGCSPAIVPTQYRLGAASPKLPQRSRLGQPATRRLHANGRRLRPRVADQGFFLASEHKAQNAKQAEQAPARCCQNTDHQRIPKVAAGVRP